MPKVKKPPEVRNPAVFAANLQRWYESSNRDLPWRRDPTVYKTVISEFMLQQTQVNTVVPYFLRWMVRFPDFSTLAEAREEEVPRRFQWYIAEGMLSLPTAKWSMVISFFSGVMASGFAFVCAKDTVEFFNAGIGEVRFPVGEDFLLVIFDYVGPWV